MYRYIICSWYTYYESDCCRIRMILLRVDGDTWSIRFRSSEQEPMKHPRIQVSGDTSAAAFLFDLSSDNVVFGSPAPAAHPSSTFETSVIMIILMKTWLFRTIINVDLELRTRLEWEYVAVSAEDFYTFYKRLYQYFVLEWMVFGLTLK